MKKFHSSLLLSSFFVSAASLLLVSCAGDKKMKNDTKSDNKNTQQQIQENIKTVKSADKSANKTFFAFDSAQLTAEGKKIIAQKAKFLKENNLKVEISGYCDERGSEAYNYQLGLRRANAVRNALVNAGVNAASISVVSYGEKPLVNGSGESVWSKNRAAVFSVEKYKQLSFTTTNSVVSFNADQFSAESFIG